MWWSILSFLFWKTKREMFLDPPDEDGEDGDDDKADGAPCRISSRSQLKAGTITYPGI